MESWASSTAGVGVEHDNGLNTCPIWRPYGTLRNSTLQNGALRNGTLRNSTLRNDPLRNGTMRHN